MLTSPALINVSGPAYTSCGLFLIPAVLVSNVFACIITHIPDKGVDKNVKIPGKCCPIKYYGSVSSKLDPDLFKRGDPLLYWRVSGEEFHDSVTRKCRNNKECICAFNLGFCLRGDDLHPATDLV